MIERLHIGNFKAISAPVTIDIRPIVLLVGPNAAGKSTILHAIHYLRELIVNDDPDPHEVADGQINLGGFRNLVHRHDPEAPIVIGADFTLEGLHASLDDDRKHLLVGVEYQAMAEAMLRAIHSVRILCIVSNTDMGRDIHRPRMDRVMVSINDEFFGQFRGLPNNLLHVLGPALGLAIAPDTFLCFNMMHPVIQCAAEMAPDLARLPELLPPLECEENRDEKMIRDFLAFPEGTAMAHSLSPLLRVDGHVLPDHNRRFTGLVDDRDSGLEDPAREILRLADAVIHTAIVEPLRYLATKILDDFCHIGPLRQIPTRDDRGVSHIKGDSWFNGSTAWRYLAEESDDIGDPYLVSDVNVKLSGKEWMDSGFSIRRTCYRTFEDNALEIQRELDMFGEQSEVATPCAGFLRKLRGDLSRATKKDLLKLVEEVKGELGNLPYRERIVIRDVQRGLDVSPEDIGTGISQVIPTLVATGSRQIGLVALEQPELHLHPRMQLAYADVLIEHALHNSSLRPKRILVETHSEHILLRLLRRMRETTQSGCKFTTEEVDHMRKQHAWGSPEYKAYEHLRERALRPEDIAVIYVEAPEKEGGSLQIRRLRVDETGEFIDRWPRGFFAEREEELFS